MRGALLGVSLLFGVILWMARHPAGPEVRPDYGTTLSLVGPFQKENLHITPDNHLLTRLSLLKIIFACFWPFLRV
jgi:hypothetical protein